MRVGDILGSRFEILAHIATGGMGHVYRARDLQSDREVAIKVLRRSADIDQQRFAREAKLLEKLTHPRIVRYVAAGVNNDGDHYMAQEWVEGTSLRDYMVQRGMTPAEAVEMARNLAEALAEAHSKGVVHRDIKPDNVILEDGILSRLRLLDFGIAREMFESIPLTRTGTMVGTPSYMAPEQARGRSNIDERADVFGLGCLLYECLTGMRPFPGPTMVAVRTKVIMCQPMPVNRHCPEAPEELGLLVQRMLAKEPEDRPRNAEAVLIALDGLPVVPDAPLRNSMSNPPRTQAGSYAGIPDDAEVELDGYTPEMRQMRKCVVLAASTADDDDLSTTRVIMDDNFAALSELQEALEPLGAELELLDGGAVVLTLATRAGDARECATRAARAALLVKEHLPGKSVAIASVGGDSSSTTEVQLERAIDWVSQAVEAAELDAIFADFRSEGDDGPAVNVDAMIAELLPPEFQLEQQSEDGWLLSDRLPTLPDTPAS